MAQTDQQFAVTQETAMTQLGIEMTDSGLRVSEQGRRQFETIFTSMMQADENTRANFTTMFDADMQTAMFNLGLDQQWWDQQMDQMRVNLERYGIDEASNRLTRDIEARAREAAEERRMQRDLAELQRQHQAAQQRGDQQAAARLASEQRAMQERIAQANRESAERRQEVASAASIRAAQARGTTSSRTGGGRVVTNTLTRPAAGAAPGAKSSPAPSPKSSPAPSPMIVPL